MTEIGKGVRARSFGALAEAYHRYRHGYPETAVDWALGRTPTRPVLLDLGAGTGKLTASLVGRGTVYAVEPDPEMLAVLRRRVPPTVRALSGSAEAIPLPDGSVDAVLVAQALHWFEPDSAYPEIVRVLRPGGVLAALWNVHDLDVGWLRGYDEVVGWARHAGRPIERPSPSHPALDPAERASFANPVPMTVDGLLGNLRTLSWISTLPPADQESTLARSRDYLLGRPETATGEFTLPLLTDVLRTHRR